MVDRGDVTSAALPTLPLRPPRAGAAAYESDLPLELHLKGEAHALATLVQMLSVRVRVDRLHRSHFDFIATELVIILILLRCADRS